MRTVFRLANRRSFSSSAIRTCKQRRSPTYGVIIRSEYRIKFKAEALPIKDRIDGCRLLFSHNAEFSMATAHGLDRLPFRQRSRVSSRSWDRSNNRLSGSVSSIRTIVEQIPQVPLGPGALDLGPRLLASPMSHSGASAETVGSWPESSPLSASPNEQTSVTTG